MRVLVGTQEPLGAAGNTYWRQVVPWSRLGSKHTVIFIDEAPRGLFLSADAICIARPSTAESLELIRSLRAAGKGVLVDFDDNLHALNADNGARILYGNDKPGTKCFEGALGLATVATTSTQRLATDYAKYRSDIAVCGNFMPDDLFDLLRPERIDGQTKRKGEIRLGYIGGRTHLDDLRLIWRPLKRLCTRYPEVKVVLFGQEPPAEYQHVPFEYHAIVMEEPGERNYEHMARYFAQVKALELDVAIAPLVSTTFNAGKSCLKALEYGAAGYPMVASSFGPYREYAGQYGSILTAFDESEWLRHLTLLVEDASARRDLAERNATVVRENFSTEKGMRSFEDALDRALSAAPA
jgi:O-antigen biosynthesis protein